MFTRRVLHHGPDPTAAPTPLSDRAIAGCWFELHRRGGCGAGEVVLRDEFPTRQAIDIGDWISCEASPGERWYLGRVEERQAASPAELRLRLEGMAVELSEVFPGGFASDLDGAPPHRFAATDLFPNDPDWSLETVDSLASAETLVHRLLEHYVVPATHIAYVPELIETPRHNASLASLKFRGEESIASITKELGLRAQAAWGVDPLGRFYFLQSRSTPLASWRVGVDVTSLAETRDREHLFNRALLTGDYIYDRLDATDHIARRSFRWRGNYTQPESRALYGDRRIRLWIPWLRTEVDSLAFVREFFRIYSVPTTRYLIETLPQSTLPFPWEGRVRLEDQNGNPLYVGAIESLRVQFDHAPRIRVELGPEDPRNLWPEPPHDERWELPEERPGGGPVSMTSQSSATSDFTLATTTATDESSLLTSDPSSGESSDASSGSGDVSSGEPSESDPLSGSSDFGSSDESDSAGSDSELDTSGDDSSNGSSNGRSNFPSSSYGGGSTVGQSTETSSHDPGGSSAGGSSASTSSEPASSDSSAFTSSDTSSV